MRFKKPKFWDSKKRTLLSFLLQPLTLPIIINNFFLGLKKNDKINHKIKKICIGNIYLGGTAKTPLSIKINKILSNLNFRTATIKKFYKDQIDEQKILSKRTKLYCLKNRKEAINEAIKDNIELAIIQIANLSSPR